VSGQKPRQIAARILRQRRAEGGFLEDFIERAFAGTDLSPANRGLCREITCGVVRWQATLDWLIDRRTGGRRQEPALRDLLRLGLYQILWLDRVPDHAAVHETVELAKSSGFGPQAGFVNAVLRGYVRAKDETKKLLADLKRSQPALGWSHPDWLVTRWRQRWGAESTARLLEWNNTPPKTFARVNTLKIARDDLLGEWRKEKVEFEAVRQGWLEEDLVFELKSHPPLPALDSFQKGGFYVQDPSTLLAAIWLAPQPGETILDYCAAPGGKTTFLAQLVVNRGRIVAQDVSEPRLKLIQENCARLGVTCVESVLPPTLNAQPSTVFDRILVDAPCSNTGVMRRRVDLRWRIEPDEINRLCGTQRELLAGAARTLKSGGVLVYSTCSLEPEENQDIIRQFLDHHPDFKLDDERSLLPFVDGVDGAYVARLRRHNQLHGSG